MAEHTPGPWTCDYTSSYAHDYRLAGPNGPLPVNAPANDRSEQRANARLIAAAPDLLAACKALMAMLDVTWDELAPLTSGGPDKVNAAADAASAAIAKAEGKPLMNREFGQLDKAALDRWITREPPDPEEMDCQKCGEPGFENNDCEKCGTLIEASDDSPDDDPEYYEDDDQHGDRNPMETE